MKVKFDPTYDECCSCVDFQIEFGENVDCKECRENHIGFLLGFVCKKKSTYAVIEHKGKLKEYPIESVTVIKE